MNAAAGIAVLAVLFLVGVVVVALAIARMASWDWADEKQEWTE